MVVRRTTDSQSSWQAPRGRSVAGRGNSIGGEESTRQRILDAASGLFLKYGYEGTTMSRIAREVGVSAPALYWHFDSKAELAFAFMEATLEAIFASIEVAMEEDTPPEQLAQFVCGYVTFELERGKDLPAQDTLYRHGYEQLLESLPDENRTRLKVLQRRPFDLLKSILEAGVSRGDFTIEDRSVTAQAIITMCDYIFTWYRPEGRFDVSTVATMYVNLAARMVGARVGAGDEASAPNDCSPSPGADLALTAEDK